MAKRRLNCIYEFDEADVKGTGDGKYIELPAGVHVAREQDVPLTVALFAPDRYENILRPETVGPDHVADVISAARGVVLDDVLRLSRELEKRFAAARLPNHAPPSEPDKPDKVA